MKLCKSRLAILPPRFIIHLGSYDPKTRRAMTLVKKGIVKKFSGQDVYPYSLDDSDLYSTDNFQIFVEKWREDKAHVFIFG